MQLSAKQLVDLQSAVVDWRDNITPQVFTEIYQRHLSGVKSLRDNQISDAMESANYEVQALMKERESKSEILLAKLKLLQLQQEGCEYAF